MTFHSEDGLTIMFHVVKRPFLLKQLLQLFQYKIHRKEGKTKENDDIVRQQKQKVVIRLIEAA